MVYKMGAVRKIAHGAMGTATVVAATPVVAGIVAEEKSRNWFEGGLNNLQHDLYHYLCHFMAFSREEEMVAMSYDNRCMRPQRQVPRSMLYNPNFHAKENDNDGFSK